uniref:Uncharacterized protein n=1 Tax=Aegilops tauschii subsp. strangulata TaxID=200361 RepID=A0A452Z580_AEGTS
MNNYSLSVHVGDSRRNPTCIHLQGLRAAAPDPSVSRACLPSPGSCEFLPRSSHRPFFLPHLISPFCPGAAMDPPGKPHSGLPTRHRRPPHRHARIWVLQVPSADVLHRVRALPGGAQQGAQARGGEELKRNGGEGRCNRRRRPAAGAAPYRARRGIAPLDGWDREATERTN